MSKIKKRLRIFAGPNGSGKSTLFEEFSKNHNTGHFINADNIEKILETKKIINLDFFNLKVSEYEFDAFLKNDNAKSLLKKSEEENHKIYLSCKENYIRSYSTVGSKYEGSLISSFLREKLIQNKQSFCFETVMSHTSKLQEIQEAKNQGYSTYFYFICIDDSEVNISRVKNRVNKGGHDVDATKIIERYSKTLNNLFPAIEICDKSYLFDNSGEKIKLIAEIQSGQSLKLHIDEKEFPNWFKNYVLKYFI